MFKAFIAWLEIYKIQIIMTLVVGAIWPLINPWTGDSMILLTTFIGIFALMSSASMLINTKMSNIAIIWLSLIMVVSIYVIGTLVQYSVCLIEPMRDIYCHDGFWRTQSLSLIWFTLPILIIVMIAVGGGIQSLFMRK